MKGSDLLHRMGRRRREAVPAASAERRVYGRDARLYGPAPARVPAAPLCGDSPLGAVGDAIEEAGGLFPDSRTAGPGQNLAPGDALAEFKTMADRRGAFCGGPSAPPLPGEHPYREITASQLAAYRDAAACEGLAPKLTFTGARPAPTAPIPVLREAAPVVAVEVTEGALVPVRVARTDREALEQALCGLERMDLGAAAVAREQEGLTHLDVRPEPGPPAPQAAQAADPLTALEWPPGGPEEFPATLAAAYKADLKMPFFHRSVLRLGWALTTARAGEWQPWGLGDPFTEATVQAGNDTFAALEELHRDAEEWADREFAERYPDMAGLIGAGAR